MIVRALALIAALLLPSCAILPMNMQPTNSGSRAAEGVWEVIDAIDTAQTAAFVQKIHTTETPNGPVQWRCHETDPVARALYGGGNPSRERVLIVNALLVPVHSYVSRWFDDRAAESQSNEDGYEWFWDTARIMWHVGSFAYSIDGVVSTRRNGCL